MHNKNDSISGWINSKRSTITKRIYIIAKQSETREKEWARSG